MHHDVVDAGADAGGKRSAVGVGESLEGGRGAVVAYERVGDAVQLDSPGKFRQAVEQIGERYSKTFKELA